MGPIRNCGWSSGLWNRIRARLCWDLLDITYRAGQASAVGTIQLGPGDEFHVVHKGRVSDKLGDVYTISLSRRASNSIPAEEETYKDRQSGKIKS